ncbi:hypothetical protein MNBD_GAMMA20-1516 [hydrothermal vent metagenome]|uniref:Uncharacterized protein n=1 Tax=hydrothermal vent metagenome TaxID=652676 RepID=A0A3B1A6L8_9ZZZZ
MLGFQSVFRIFTAVVLLTAVMPLLAASVRTEALVTLYSEGKVVVTYEAVDAGHADGNCYIFHVRKGVRDVEVRVCGTYTVEKIR